MHSSKLTTLTFVHESNVAVKVRAEGMAEAFNVLLRRNRISEVIVHAATIKGRLLAKNRIKYHDAMHGRITVGFVERSF